MRHSTIRRISDRSSRWSPTITSRSALTITWISRTEYCPTHQQLRDRPTPAPRADHVHPGDELGLHRLVKWAQTYERRAFWIITAAKRPTRCRSSTGRRWAYNSPLRSHHHEKNPCRRPRIHRPRRLRRQYAPPRGEANQNLTPVFLEDVSIVDVMPVVMTSANPIRR